MYSVLDMMCLFGHVCIVKNEKNFGSRQRLGIFFPTLRSACACHASARSVNDSSIIEMRN